MRLFSLLSLPVLLFTLTGCTDVRRRLSPDLLAADASGTAETRFAAHSSQSDGLISAESPSPMLMPDALGLVSGMEISTGHLSMLAVSGQPATVTAAYLQKGWLAPTCAVLAVSSDACSMLRRGKLPAPEQLRAAVSEGLLPARTADTVVGDMQSGSGVTAFPTVCDSRLTLVLCEDDTLGVSLSENACRGLALLGRRWDTFCFSAEGTPCSVKRARLRIHAAQEGETLSFSVGGTVTCETVSPDAVKSSLTEMLLSALRETAQDSGADLCFLRECAVRDHIPDAADCPLSVWRDRLRSANYSAEITVRQTRFVQGA